MKRNLIYYSVIIVIIYLSNSGLLQSVLNAVVGIKWSDPIVNFIKINTQGLIIILLLSIYLEYIKKPDDKILHLKSDLLKELPNMIKQTLMAGGFISEGEDQAILTRILKAHYGEDVNVNNLANTVLSSRVFYTDVSVSNKLIGHKENPELYDLEYEIDFKASINEFVIALVCSSHLQDRISSSCTKINDVLVFSSQSSFVDNVNKIKNSEQSFRVVIESTEGLSNHRNCKFNEVNKNEYRNYLHDIHEDEFKNISLLRAKIPSDVKIINYLLSLTFKMHKEDHYCYWVADRPMYLNKIGFDATQLNYKDKTVFIFQPFFMNLSGIIQNPSQSSIFSLDVHNWVVKGQGAFLTWR